MLSGTFIAQLDTKNQVNIPYEISERLQLQEGEKVEVLLKRIRTKRLNIKIAQNPLAKLLEISGDERR